VEVLDLVSNIVCSDLEISRCSGLFMRQIHRNKFFITADQLQRECCTKKCCMDATKEHFNSLY